MLEEMIKGIINNELEKTHSHLRIPNSVYVKITKVTQGEFDWEYPVKVKMDLNLNCPYNSSVHAEGEAVIQNPYYIYNLKILNEDRTIDDTYPEIPDVKSYVKLENGDIAVATFLYGNVNPYIIGKVI